MLSKTPILAMLPIEISDKDNIFLLRKSLKAQLKINEVKHMLKGALINKDIFSFFYLQEAIKSTRIEGTQTTFTEVMESKITGKISSETNEVQNYIKALEAGFNYISFNKKIDKELLLELQRIILGKKEGKFRDVQNYIGTSSKNIIYTPPKSEDVMLYIDNLIDFINNNEEFDTLVKVGILHAQFESIHPFKDGNGRVGRILISLYLYKEGLIDNPFFFISEELEKNKNQYYSLLTKVRENEKNWVEWLSFFIDSSAKQADKYLEKFNKINNIHKKILEFSKKEKIESGYIMAVLLNPIFSIRDLQEKMLKYNIKLSYNTIKMTINKLEEANFISQIDKNKKRNKMYIFPELVDVLSY